MKLGKQSFVCLVLATGLVAAQDKPRVYLQSVSHGNTWAARRDQSMEMAKDFEKNCPGVAVTIAQDKADYTIILSHLEVGLFFRDNQIEIANREGDILRTQEKGGIKRSVTDACSLILDDWEERNGSRAARPSSQPEASVPVDPVAARRHFADEADRKLRGRSAGFAEVVDTTLVVHSIYADKDHYSALIRDKTFSSELRRCGFTRFIYTDDGKGTFTWDIEPGKEKKSPYSF